MSPSIQPVCRYWARIKWSPGFLKGTLILLINCAPFRSRMHKLVRICTSSQLFWVQPDREQTGPAYRQRGADGSHFVSSGSVNTQMKESYFHFSCMSEWELTGEEVQSPTGDFRCRMNNTWTFLWARANGECKYDLMYWQIPHQYLKWNTFTLLSEACYCFTNSNKRA